MAPRPDERQPAHSGPARSDGSEAISSSSQGASEGDLSGDSRVDEAATPIDEAAADVVLAGAAREGDETAFELLVDRYHRLIFKIAYNKCNHAMDAEDLTQEIFLHAFRSLPNLRDPQAFLGWLLAIAHNRGNRFCRSRQGKIIALETARQELQAAHHPARARLTEEVQAHEPEEGGVSQLVGSLPDEYRLALTWKYLDGSSYDEIGERLSMSFNQVDYLMRRAKKALRTLVERENRKQEGRRS